VYVYVYELTAEMYFGKVMWAEQQNML